MNLKLKKATVFLISLFIMAGICLLAGNIGVPQVNAVGVWTFTDGGGSTGLNYDTTHDAGLPAQASYNGELYAAWYETNGITNQVRVKKYNGFTWTSVDGGGTNGLNWNTAMNAVNPVMMVCNNILYIAWEESADGVGRIHVKKYDGGNSWTLVDDGVSGLNYSATASAGAPVLAVFNGEIYTSWKENGVNGKGQIRVKKYDGTTWNFVDGAGSAGLNYNSEENANHPKLALFGTGLYAAWEEVSGGISQIRVKRYDGGNTWTFIDGGTDAGLNWDSARDANCPELIDYNGAFYAVWEELCFDSLSGSIRNIRLKKYNGTNWSFVDGGSNTGCNKNPSMNATNPALYVYNNLLYITWSEMDDINNAGQIRAVKYNGTARTFIDGDTVAGLNKNTAMPAENPIINVFNGDLAIAWSENYGQISQIRVKKLSLPALITSVTVPVNGTYGLGQALNFTVNFSKSVNVSGGTPYIPLTLNTGGTVSAQYVSGTGTNALLFRYTIVSGNLDTNGITLGGSITNTMGTIGDTDNSADLTLRGVPGTAGILVDGVAPKTTSMTAPANGTYAIGQNLDFTMNYNEPVFVDTTGGTPYIHVFIDTGGGAKAYYVSGSGTNALLFRCMVKSGDQDTNGISVGFSTVVNGGTIRDAAANNAETAINSLPSMTGILVDGIAPKTTQGWLKTGQGPYIAGQNIDLDVYFSEVVNVNTTGGIPYIEVTMDTGTVNATYLSGSGTTILTFRYTVQAGDQDTNGFTVGGMIIENGGTICDRFNNNATLNISGFWYTNGVLVDTAPSTVVSVSMPVNRTYNTGYTLSFTVNFNEPVKVTNTGGTPYLPIILNDGVTVNAQYSGTYGTLSTTLQFYYTVKAGHLDTDGITLGTSIVANGGTIRDNATNNAVLTLNNVGNSTEILVDGVAPAVSSFVLPVYGSYGIGQNMDLTLNFSEVIQVNTTGGIPYVSVLFNSGGSSSVIVKAYYVSGSGTNALLFRYTVSSGDQDTNGIMIGNSITANGGTLRDTAGNNALLSLTLTGVGIFPDILVDGIIPKVVTVPGPSNGTYCTGQDLNFSVNFSEAITVDTAGGIPYIPVTLDTGGTVNANYVSGSGNKILIFRYTVQAGNFDSTGIALRTSIIPNGAILGDTANNNAELTLNGRFSTAGVLIDAVAPEVISVSVPDDRTYNEGANLNFTVTFSKVVSVNTTNGTPYIPITLDTGGIVNANYASGSGTGVLIFHYGVQSGNLDTDGIALSNSIVTGGGTLKDVAGNDAVLLLNNIESTAGVLVDALAPAVSSVTVPVNGTYGSGQSLDFIVNFSEAVIVNFAYGTPYIPVTLDSGSTVNALYGSGSGTDCLIFRYTIQAGNQDTNGIELGNLIIANTGAINDMDGNHLLPALHGVAGTGMVLVDGIAPVLVNTIRTDNTHLFVTLDQDCTGLTKGNDGGFTVHENSNRGITYPVSSITQGADAGHVILTLADMDVSGKYGVIIKYTMGENGTIRDMAGNSMTTDNTGLTVASWNENRPPQLAVISGQTVDEGQLLQFSLIGTDPDGDALTYSAFNLPEGAVFNPATGVFTWTPTYSNSGIHHMQFSIFDGDLTDSQDVDVTVIDKGILVTIRLNNSNGIGISDGKVSYSGNGWQNVGDTGSDGTVNTMLPLSVTSLTVRMTYGGMTRDLTQNIQNNSTFTFQTVNSTIVFKDSTGNGIPGGVVTYAGSSWLSFGTTGTTGEVRKELLPGSYKFRMTYAGALKDVTQDVGINSTITFQTQNVLLSFKDSAGNGISGGVVIYAGSSWLNFGTTGSSGEFRKELLPGSYKFRMTYAGASQDITQDIGLNPNVSYQTKRVLITLNDTAGNGLSGGLATYAGSSWLNFGTTDIHGETRKELLPVSYTFRMVYGGTTNNKVQDIGANLEVSFQF